MRENARAGVKTWAAHEFSFDSYRTIRGSLDPRILISLFVNLRMTCVRTRNALILVSMLGGASAARAQSKEATTTSDPAAIRGEWRVSRGRHAPWIEAKDPVPDTTEWLRKRIVFEGKRVTGPKLLTCHDASYESIDFPAEGLFQGGLPEPAESAARILGIRAFPVPSVELNCETGIFDFHLVDRTTMLVAVDNVIWTLTRTTAPRAASRPK
jgi:hypothetical protein